MENKTVSAYDAAALINSGDTVTTSGFVGAGVPEGLLKALGDRFAREGQPRDLTLLFAAGQGDGKGRGLDRLAAPGLVRRIVGGHWGLIPQLGARALKGEIEGWNFPQGVISTSTATSPPDGPEPSAMSGWRPSSTRAWAAARSAPLPARI